MALLSNQQLEKGAELRSLSNVEMMVQAACHTMIGVSLLHHLASTADVIHATSVVEADLDGPGLQVGDVAVAHHLTNSPQQQNGLRLYGTIKKSRSRADTFHGPGIGLAQKGDHLIGGAPEL
jgi:hypothetical protein